MKLNVTVVETIWAPLVPLTFRVKRPFAVEMQETVAVPFVVTLVGLMR